MNFFGFKSAPRPEALWFPVGLSSSFPDLGGFDDDGLSNLGDARMCNAELKPGCKVFRIPQTDPSQGAEVPILEDGGGDFDEDGFDLKDQVMVFQYKGKFHAVDHQCPHASFPLSKGIPFDIEDFGVVLSAGVTCPKHGWSFDIFSGTGDRGNYKLKIWEVQLRDVKEPETPKDVGDGANGSETVVKEVWVRRKPRMG
ncbi:hypothetical protein BGZ63DRAFT_406039 [Mariannaea sp. PMI_226]|nr:hypothetical protein BGZ63DRAFT_406039 [Mariannaea sp. PMI_226]